MTDTAIAEIPAGSAPANDPVKSNFEAWQKTVRPAPTPEESAPPAQPDKAAAEPAKAEAAPESAPEEKPQEKGKAHDGTKAEDRVKQLLSERNKLEKRIRELEEGAKQPPKAESAPPAKPSAKLEAPVKPKLENFKTYEEYDAAKDEYYDKLAEFKAKQAVEQDRQARAQEEVNRTVAQKIQEAKSRYEDYDDVAKPFAGELAKAVSEQRVHPMISEVFGRQPHMADIMYVIGKDAKETADFLELAHSDPIGAMQKIVIFNSLVADELAKAKPEANPETPKAEKSESKPPAPPETKASKPPSEVGGRAAAPPDALEAASQRRDFRSFEQEATRRYLEKRK